MESAAAPTRAFPRPGYAWYCLSIICFAYLFGFMDRIIVGLLTPAIQADLGLSDSQMGIIQGLAFAVFYTLFGIPLGLAADRTNRTTRGDGCLCVAKSRMGVFSIDGCRGAVFDGAACALRRAAGRAGHLVITRGTAGRRRNRSSCTLYCQHEISIILTC